MLEREDNWKETIKVHKNKRVGIIGICITLIILIILVIFTNMNLNKFSQTEGFFNKLIMPIQNGLTYLKNKITGNNIFFENINNLKEENEELSKKNEELEKQIRELEIIKAENSTLRQYVNMSEKYTEYKTIPAYIINKDISNLSSTFVINIGTEDGIQTNMPVIASKILQKYNQ